MADHKCPTAPYGILYVLRTGCQWKMMPPEYSSGSTGHLRFQTWVRAGIFKKIWRKCLKDYDDLKGVDWRFQSLDGVIVSAFDHGGAARAAQELQVPFLGGIPLNTAIRRHGDE